MEASTPSASTELMLDSKKFHDQKRGKTWVNTGHAFEK